MDDQRYFSRSWAMLTRDKGWIKPLLVMAAASLVPVVGEFGNKGFALEWARLTAWGVDSAPKQKNVDIGKCVTSGARAFVVSLGWGVLLSLVIGTVNVVFSFLPGNIGGLLAAMASLALSVIMAIANLAIMVAELRTAIYEKIGAGYQPNRIIELIRRDTSGFLRVFLIQFVCGFIIAAIVTVFVIICMLFFIPFFLRLNAGYTNSDVVLGMLAGMIVPFVAVCVVFGYVISFVANAVRMLVVNALGLWMRQFDVPNWGRSEDPLPDTSGPQTSAQQWQQPMQAQGGQPGMYAHPAQQAPAQQPMQTQQVVQPAQSAQQAEQAYRVAQQEAEKIHEQTLQQQVVPQQTEASVQPQPQPEVEAWQQEPEAMQQPPQQVVSQQPQPQPETVANEEAPKPASEQLPPTISLKPEASDHDDKKDAEDLYESMSEAIRENDRVEGD